MTIEDLKKLYPSGKLATKPAEKHYLSLFVDPNYFIIDKKQLNKNEIHLLQALFSSQNSSIDNYKHPWFSFLFEQKSLDLKGSFRIIQFSIEATDSFLKNEWLKSLRGIFPSFVDLFFISEHSGILVESYTKQHYSLNEINDLFLTLDDDFEIKTVAFIGNFFSHSEPIPLLFEEEQHLFRQHIPNFHTNKVVSFNEVGLRHFSKDLIKHSLIAQHLTKEFSSNKDIQPIIMALWEAQGNLSLTAKKLFMHRNTLQYRIDKFYDQTGFSLKKMEDLVLCYLLLLQK